MTERIHDLDFLCGRISSFTVLYISIIATQTLIAHASRNLFLLQSLKY